MIAPGRSADRGRRRRLFALLGPVASRPAGMDHRRASPIPGRSCKIENSGEIFYHSVESRVTSRIRANPPLSALTFFQSCGIIVSKGGVLRASGSAGVGAAVLRGPSSIVTDHSSHVPYSPFRKDETTSRAEDREPGEGDPPKCCHLVPTRATAGPPEVHVVKGVTSGSWHATERSTWHPVRRGATRLENLNPVSRWSPLRPWESGVPSHRTSLKP